jgi:hypothetical protein
MADNDLSSLIKHSLKELYEDIIDREVINDYEKPERESLPARSSSSLVGREGGEGVASFYAGQF